MFVNLCWPIRPVSSYFSKSRNTRNTNWILFLFQFQFDLICILFGAFDNKEKIIFCWKQGFAISINRFHFQIEGFYISLIWCFFFIIVSLTIFVLFCIVPMYVIMYNQWIFSIWQGVHDMLRWYTGMSMKQKTSSTFQTYL